MLLYIEEGSSTFGWIAKSCPCRGLNTCPPDKELGTLTKELASLLRLSWSLRASLQNSIQHPVSGILSERREVLLLPTCVCVHACVCERRLGLATQMGPDDVCIAPSCESYTTSQTNM
jgi:hypothetical protein